MNTSSNIKPETVYDVKFYLKGDYYKDLLDKHNNILAKHYDQPLGKAKSETDVFKNDKLKKVKIPKAPDFYKLWSKALTVGSLIKYITKDVERYWREGDPKDLIDVIYNGQDKKNPKEHIYPKTIIDDIGHSFMIIDLAEDILKKITKKFVDYQEFIEYHLKEKENIEERKTVKKAV